MPIDWDALDGAKHQDETEAVAGLIARIPLNAIERDAVRAEAEALVRAARSSASSSVAIARFSRSASSR